MKKVEIGGQIQNSKADQVKPAQPQNLNTRNNAEVQSIAILNDFLAACDSE